MKKIFITCAAILAFFSSCSSILDKEDLSSISEEQVWVDRNSDYRFPERTVCFHPELGYNSGRCK